MLKNSVFFTFANMITLESFQELALSFEDATEQPHFERPSFRVNKKIFATLNSAKQTATVKLTEIDQSAFCAFDDSIIYPVKGSWGKQGWTTVELTKVRKETLMDLLTTAYNTVALKKQ